MLVVRQGQMAVFARAAIENFEREMREHLKTFTPKHCEVLGDDGVRRVVQLGRGRAGAYGFANRGPVRLYIELMFMFGSDFDTDPQYPWTAQILAANNGVDQMTRADRLYEKTLDYLEKVAGPDNEYAKAALRRVKEQRLDAVRASPGSLETEALSRMKQNYPEKCQYVGDAALRALIPRGIESAKQHGVATDKGSILFIALAFVLGHGFASDPQFPWIESTLKNDHITDADRRIERLYSKAMTYLDHVLAYHGE